MTRDEKAAKKRDAKYRINSPKSALMQVVSQLEAIGLGGKAEQLSKIIARLEDFQNSI